MSAVNDAISAMQGLKDAHERLKALQDDRQAINKRSKELDGQIDAARANLDTAKAAAKAAVNGAL